MKQKLFIIVLIVVVSVFTVKAQVGVGVGTTTPTETLHVVGNLKLSGELTMENPGGFTTINNQEFLIKTAGGAVRSYDISAAKYAPINYVIYKFNGLGSDGLQNYNTKIPVAKYFVALQSFHLADPNMALRETLGTDRVQGIVARAYESGGTWWFQLYVNNSKFNVGGSDSNVNLTVNVLIYRKNLLASSSGVTIEVDMNGSTGKGNNAANPLVAAPVPTGY